MAKEQNRGPGARKVELERRLDRNTETTQEGVRQGEAADADDAAEGRAYQQATGRGHKAQQAERHRSGRPSGGNVTGSKHPEDLDR
jgi:hypothetical protein